MFKSTPIKAQDPVIVSISEWQGKNRLDIRHYYYAEIGDGDVSCRDLRPTQKGVSIPVNDAVAVSNAVSEVMKMSEGGAKPARILANTSCSAPVVVSLNQWKGVNRLDIRHHYTDKRSGELLPSQKGISIQVSEVSRFVEYLAQAISEIDSIPVEMPEPVAINDRRFAYVEAY